MGSATRRERVVRMSVEQPLWRALTAYRVLTMVYAIGLFASAYEVYERPWVGIAYFVVLAVWTLSTLPQVSGARRCTKRFLTLDLAVAVGGILLSPVAGHDRAVTGGSTLPSIWTAGAVLAWALKGGWRWAAFASVLIGVVNVVQRGDISRSIIHNVLLVCIAGTAIGYVVEVARASERTLARALEIEATTRERERLARDIHDSVLQVLAMVQRRGTALGGEAAELGRMAGEQEIALRTLVTEGLRRPSHTSEDLSRGAVVRAVTTYAEADPPQGPRDLRPLLAPHADARTTFSAPGTAVLMPAAAARELAAAVAAALDNVRRHAGGDARAWILVEDEPDAVIVTVRDDGPGIPEGRLAQAEGEGRLGVAQSIRGRLRDIGGTAELISVPGQGTEVELHVPKNNAPKNNAPTTSAPTTNTPTKNAPTKNASIKNAPKK
ncbi:MacS family sensor histidine kinase [Streptomyces sp. NPDC088785]|uniref:MacS family sensor histidine kinase n=1 Tax=Streptomyces sp. NPDC088785 TaxID=3365897 RepID=UPI00381A8241